MAYLDENCGSTLSGSEYYWVPDDCVDITTKSTDYTYDRIIFIDSTFNDFTGIQECIGMIFGLERMEMTTHAPKVRGLLKILDNKTIYSLLKRSILNWQVVYIARTVKVHCGLS